jgi:hypothetical protein
MNNITRRKPLIISLAIVFAALFGGVAVSRALAEDICVAVLAPEVVADLPAGERKTLAGALDTILTEGLAGRKGFVLVDRLALDKVLAEKKTRINAKDVAAGLRPFWSAGVLICPMIRPVNPKDKSGKMIVSVEAVLAQTGQLLAELHAQGVWKKGKWTKPPKVAENLAAFRADIARNLGRNLNRPVVEVSAGRLTSKLTRLQWKVDELTDALSSCVGAERGVVLLRPRQPLSTKEERLLRVMGLSDAKPRDRAAGLTPTSDMRLTTELIETVSSKLSFRKTPIKVKLTLRAGRKVVGSKLFSGTVGSSGEIRVAAVKWFVEQVGKSTKMPTGVNPEKMARKLAAEEMEYLRKWMSFGYGDRDLETEQLIRLVRRALRASHLDPTCEEAAYLVAIHVGILYADDTMACRDRILAESRKYLDRFGPKNASHHRQVLSKVLSTAYGASYMVRGGRHSYTAILGKPNPKLYPYARASVQAMAEQGYLAETDKRYSGTNAFSQMGHWLRRDLIPTIPDDRLDEEYEYWRRFWKTKVEKVPGNKADPWDLIEAAFQARRRDARGLRVTLQKLADKYPPSQNRIWRLAREEIVPLYLRASGASDWKTWKPKPAGKAISIPYPERMAYAKRFNLPFPPVWDYENLPVLNATKLVFPKQVLDLGDRGGRSMVTRPRIAPLCQAGGDIWFITPTRWNTVNLKVPQYLHLVSEKEAFAASQGDLNVTPRRLHWPKHPRLDVSVKVDGAMNQLTITWVCATGSGLKQTVWISTKWHGVARFDKKGKEWAGRWYTSRDGMPSDVVRWVLPYRGRGGKPMMLIYGAFENKQDSKRVGLWTIDPSTHRVKVIAEDKIKGSKYRDPMIAVWPDKRVLLIPSELPSAGELDFEKVQRFEELNLFNYYYKYLYVTQDRGERTIRRRWRMDDGKLWEVTKISLSPPKVHYRLVARTPSSKEPDAPFDLSRAHNGDPSATAWNDTLWLSVNHDKRFAYRKRDGLLIFRPAPLGDKTAANQWIGPFGTPDRERITNLWPDRSGHVWVTTPASVYRVDAKQLLVSKLAIGQTRTKKQWRSEYLKRMGGANWRCRVRTLVQTRQWSKAVKILDIQRKSLGTVTAASDAVKTGDHADLLMWCAEVMSKKPGGTSQAIKLYQQIEADPLVDRTARRDARRGIIVSLCKTGDHAGALKRAEEYYRFYPPRGGVSGDIKLDHMKAMIKKARKAIGRSK